MVTDGETPGFRAYLVTPATDQEQELEQDYTVGRASDTTIRLEDDLVSRHHARLERREDGYLLTDLGSSNGTFVNDERLAGPRLLQAGDRIKIGSQEFEYRYVPPPPPPVEVTIPLAVPAQGSLVDARGTRWPVVGEEFSIGRTDVNDLAFDDPSMSRQHALIQRVDGSYVLSDRNSRNGTLVNGKRVDAPHPLSDGDEITLGSTRLHFELVGDPEQTVALDMDESTRTQQWVPDAPDSAATADIPQHPTPAETMIGTARGPSNT